jgi:hypothetical protein
MLLLASRWLPGRRLIAVADTTYAVIELLAALRHRLTMVTRLRLDARLFDPPRRPGTRGRVTGQRQLTLVQRLADPASRWRRVTVSQWYGEGKRELDILTGTAVHPGRRVPVRWVLVRDVVGDHDPQAFLCTDLEADALDVLRWFVRRWAVEVTFEEVRRHLGVERQQGQRPHHAGLAGAVLPRHPLGPRPRRTRSPQSSGCRLVPQAAPDF